MILHPAPFPDPEIDRWRIYLNELAQLADRASLLQQLARRRDKLAEMRQIIDRAERHLDERR